MAVDEKYVEKVTNPDDFEDILASMGIEADFKPLSDNGLDLQGYTQTLLNEMYDGDECIGRPVLSNTYVREFTDKNTGETQVNHKIDLVLLDDSYEEEKEANIFPINLKDDEDMQHDISPMSGLYALVIGLMEIQAPGISAAYNNIKKVSLKCLRKQLEGYEEMTVKVVEKEFKNRAYNSFIIKEGIKKQ